MTREGKRLTGAILIVTAIVFAAPLTDAAFKPTTSSRPTASDNGGINIASALTGGSVDDAITQLELLVNQTSTLPEWFQEEAGALPGAHDVRVSGSVVGYTVEGNDADVLKELQAHMTSRGWTCVPLGGIVGATFVKESGSFTWALVTCTQVGSVTSVVTRCNLA